MKAFMGSKTSNPARATFVESVDSRDRRVKSYFDPVQVATRPRLPLDTNARQAF